MEYNISFRVNGVDWEDLLPEQKLLFLAAKLGPLAKEWTEDERTILLPKEPNKESIYALVDPETKKIMYVGRTRTTLEEQLDRHCRNTNAGNPRKRQWILSLKEKGLKPDIVLLEEVEDATKAADLKRLYIRQFSAANKDLLNIVGNPGISS